jgi:hypothetical protein
VEVQMTLADIVVDQLVFVLGASEEVLDPDAAIDLLENAVGALAGLAPEELAMVRRAAEGRTSAGSVPEGTDAARELVLLLDEISAG